MATIELYGDIGESWWFDESYTTKWMADQLARIPENEAITLRINSVGGDVSHGLGMYNLLKDRRANVVAVVDGYALSAASIVMCGASRVIVPETAIVMLHNPSTIAYGTAKEMRKTADILDTHRDACVAAYRDRLGKSDAEIIQLLDDETWMTGAEAVALGLADESPSEPDQPVDNHLPNWFRVSAKGKKKLKAIGRLPGKVAAKGTIKKREPMENIDNEVTAQLIELQTTVAALQKGMQERVDQIAKLEAEKLEIENRANVTASWQAFHSAAERLVRDLKLSPPEFEALFTGDRASAEKLLVSANCENHLFYLRETIAAAEARSSVLPTEFKAKDGVAVDPIQDSAASKKYGSNLNPESAREDAEIRAKVKEMGGNPDNTSDYLKAMNALGFTY